VFTGGGLCIVGGLVVEHREELLRRQLDVQLRALQRRLGRAHAQRGLANPQLILAVLAAKALPNQLRGQRVQAWLHAQAQLLRPDRVGRRAIGAAIGADGERAERGVQRAPSPLAVQKGGDPELHPAVSSSRIPGRRHPGNIAPFACAQCADSAAQCRFRCDGPANRRLSCISIGSQVCLLRPVESYY